MTIKAIPTNIITGFLGVGKTTAIKSLLETKPENERWAVLVNEFGEIGIDGGLYTGTSKQEDGVFIKEVPGGCMCCAAGLPMQIALNKLLTKANPHRLIIEPTGLGHPKEVMGVLNAEHYREVLNLNTTITLVDARKISEKRYTDNATFNQQLDIADVIIASKSDQYAEHDFSRLLEYLGKRHGEKVKPIYPVSFGKLELAWLEGKASAASCQDHHHHSHSRAPALADEQDFPESGFVSVANEGEGFVSLGWKFAPELIFEREKLYSLLMGIQVERLKGVFVTSEGVIGYNNADNVLTEVYLDDCMDSRIELIAEKAEAFNHFESALLECLLNS